MNIHALYQESKQPEIDYLLLKSLLSEKAAPRDKITSFLKQRSLVRVKKGLYVFDSKVSPKPYSKELLANLIYGPSAISLEYALAFYGLIPEKVSVITSITNKRNKYFSTPVGVFTYRYLSTQKYTIGITRANIDTQRHILIATPEKALADTLYFSSCKKMIKTHHDIENYLFEDRRIDENEFKRLDKALLQAIALQYKNKLVNLCVEYLS